MKLNKIKKLKLEDKVIIKGEEYDVIGIGEGIDNSEEVHEVTLKDKHEQKFLLQILLAEEELKLWKLSLGYEGKKGFKRQDLVDIKPEQIKSVK